MTDAHSITVRTRRLCSAARVWSHVGRQMPSVETRLTTATRRVARDTAVLDTATRDSVASDTVALGTAALDTAIRDSVAFDAN